ncbi:MAG: helix-turn-helix domain-containing protein [Sulfolobales archaeon]|nr:helix-turn-helix domain-containing protein [Sulfolobales archaeon]
MEKYGLSYVARNLGVDGSTLYRYVSGKVRKVPDNVIAAAAETLDLEELGDVLYGFRTVDVDPTVALSVEIKALRGDVFRNFFLTLPYQYVGGYLRTTTSTYIVSEDDLKKFETLLSNKSNNCSHGDTNAVCSNTTNNYHYYNYYF